jgi:hypothetical protein
MAANEQLGWRVYVRAGAWDIYSYTVLGAKGEKEACAIVKSLVCTGDLKLRGMVTTVVMEDLLPPPASE